MNKGMVTKKLTTKTTRKTTLGIYIYIYIYIYEEGNSDISIEKERCRLRQEGKTLRLDTKK